MQKRAQTQKRTQPNYTIVHVYFIPVVQKRNDYGETRLLTVSVSGSAKRGPMAGRRVPACSMVSVSLMKLFTHNKVRSSRSDLLVGGGIMHLQSVGRLNVLSQNSCKIRTTGRNTKNEII